MTELVLHHRGLGFVMVRKACTTSIKRAVLAAMGHEPGPDIHADDRLQYCMVSEAPVLGLGMVATIRHPLGRLVSTWRNKVHDEADQPGGAHLQALGVPARCTFAEFVDALADVHTQEAHTRPQVSALPPCLDYVLQFERIADQWPRIQSVYPWLPALGLSNRTRYDKPQWLDYYDGATYEKAAALYADDLRLWAALDVRAHDDITDPRE